MKEEIKKILDIADKTYYNWKNQNRPIINLLENNFTEKDMQEFLKTGEIQKFKNFKYLYNNYLGNNKVLYINSFESSNSLLHKSSTRSEFKDFYLSFLVEFDKTNFPFNINILGIQSLLTHFLYQFQIEKLKNYGYSHTNDNIEIDKFNHNEREFDGIMCHYFTFNSWNNDIYYFIELLKKDDFDYFINSNNDELLYQAIGYLVYSAKSSKNLEMINKLELVYLTFNYFIFNKDLISTKNVKEHILIRLKKTQYFKEKDDEIEKIILNEPIFIATIENNLIEEPKVITWDELIENQKN